MALSPQQTRHVATLARLSLTAEEEQRFGQQLSAILDAVALLDQVDTAEVPPTLHATAGDAPVVRPDEPRPSLSPDDALGNAPSRSGTSFAVPKIIE